MGFVKIFSEWRAVVRISPQLRAPSTYCVCSSEWTPPTPLTHWALFPEGRLSTMDYKPGEHLAPSPQPQTTWLISSKKAPPRLSASKVHLIWQHDLWIQTHMFGLKCLHNSREKRFVFAPPAVLSEAEGEKKKKKILHSKIFFSLYLNKSCPQCNRQLATTLMSPRELQCTFDQRVCRSCSATSTELATFCGGFHGEEKCLFIAKKNTSVVFRICIPLRHNPDPSTRLVRLHGSGEEKSAAACFMEKIVQKWKDSYLTERRRKYINLKVRIIIWEKMRNLYIHNSDTE